MAREMIGVDELKRMGLAATNDRCEQRLEKLKVPIAYRMAHGRGEHFCIDLEYLPVIQEYLSARDKTRRERLRRCGRPPETRPSPLTPQDIADQPGLFGPTMQAWIWEILGCTRRIMNTWEQKEQGAATGYRKIEERLKRLESGLEQLTRLFEAAALGWKRDHPVSDAVLMGGLTPSGVDHA